MKPRVVIAAVIVFLTVIGLAPAFQDAIVKPNQQQNIIAQMALNLELGRAIDPNTRRHPEALRRNHAGQSIQMWQIICLYERPEFNGPIEYGCSALAEQWPWLHEQCEWCQN